MIGIEDDFTVTGIDDYHERVNDILRVPYGKLNFDGLNKTEQAVYSAIAGTPKISRKMLIETIDRSPRTIDRAIQSLIDKGKIKRVGSKKTGYWEIVTIQ